MIIKSNNWRRQFGVDALNADTDADIAAECATDKALLLRHRDFQGRLVDYRQCDRAG